MMLVNSGGGGGKETTEISRSLLFQYKQIMKSNDIVRNNGIALFSSSGEGTKLARNGILHEEERAELVLETRTGWCLD